MKSKIKNKKNILKGNLFYIIIFCLGILFVSYPFVSQIYYRYGVDSIVQKFDTSAKELNEKELKNRIELARAYNATLNPEKLADPYNEKEKEGIAEYARMLEIHEMLGYVEVPKINEKLPIYAGTKGDVLEKGAGHLEGSSLPIGGSSTHSVITAHRGLATAKLFRDLDKLEKGDVFFIHNIEKVIAYEVDQILTIEPSNFQPVLVVKDKDYCTLLTCTPYLINSHRLLVRGHRIDYNPEVEKGSVFSIKDIYLVVLVVAGLIVVSSLYFIKKQRKKRDE